MADVTQLANLKYDPLAVQGFAGTLVWMLIGIIGLGLLGYFGWKLFQDLTAPYLVYVREKRGKGEMRYYVKARQIVDGMGNYMINFIGLGQAPQWDKFSDYVYSERIKTFGIMPGVMQGFTVFKDGKKIVPCSLGDTHLDPVDYDMFNYMQWKVKANVQKYTKEDWWRMNAPIILMGGVILAFILGSYFWGKHVESVAGMILDKATIIATNTLQNSGSVQVLQPK